MRKIRREVTRKNVEDFGPVRITRVSRTGHTTKANEASEDLRSLGRGRWASLYFLRSVGKECFGEPPKPKREPACAPQMLLRCEGGDDLFEARVAAQWIPKRHQFQLTISDWAWRRAIMASCWQARSLSPTQAAIIARYLITAGPLSASFSTGRSSTACRPSRSASSLRLRAASIRPSTHHGGPKFGSAWT